jgi:arginyl-tRNA synthetase
VAEKNPEIDLSSAEGKQLCSDVGVGAVVFNDLKNSRVNDVKLKFDEILRFEGFTGPYVQFSHARLCSIERKFADMHPNAPAPNPALLSRDDEKAVLLTLAKLQPQLERAVELDEPSVLITALLGFASVVSTWLTAGNTNHAARVLCEDAATAATRLALVRVARANLAEGLRLIGLKAPQRM